MIVKDFKNKSNLWIKSAGTWPEKAFSISGLLFSSMHQRCKINGIQQKLKPNYVGCTTSENFKCFQFFTDWCHKQIGYNNLFQLDKDILIKNNKLYSENTCVFIPKGLNTFLTNTREQKGKNLIGAAPYNNSFKFRSYISINNKRTVLGIFNTEILAHHAWITAKEAEAYRWYERLRDGEFIVDPRVIERMRTWRYEP
jgi:hypothetical protein